MDGTLCDTDPLHHEVFSNLLLAHGKNGGVPIDTNFFHEHIAGRTNEDIFADLWPELSVPEREAMWEKKEEDFRTLAASKLERLPGLTELLAWIDSRGVRKVAVTNAPRPNAELMLRALGLETYCSGRERARLLALRVRCCWARAQGAHRSACCTHEELATAVRRMPMYTACGCCFIARGCRKQCAVISARSALLEKWKGLSERRKCLFLAPFLR